MKEEGFVGVAIVAWNNSDILPTCLDSIKKQTYKKIKTIVLDNHSSDSTAKIVKNDYPWAALIKRQTNTGFSKGNNTIIKEFLKDKTIEYMVLLNSDAALDQFWVEKVVSFAESSKKTAFIQGLTLDYYDHSIIDSTHIYINRSGQAVQAGHRSVLKTKRLNNTQIFGVNAAACMVTREFIEQQPFDYLFDEDFFMYLEDVDVAARSIALGWNNYFRSDAIAYHMGSASSGRNPGFSVFMVNRNILPTLYKNLPLVILVKITPRMIIADIKELYKIARGKNYVLLRKYLSGRIVGFFSLPRYYKKRRVLFVRKTENSRNIWCLMKDGTIKE